MLRVKRFRWPDQRLTARYRCPNKAHRPMLFSVLVSKLADNDPRAGIWGRPGRAICDCGEEMSYEGLVR